MITLRNLDANAADTLEKRLLKEYRASCRKYQLRKIIHRIEWWWEEWAYLVVLLLLSTPFVLGRIYLEMKFASAVALVAQILYGGFEA